MRTIILSLAFAIGLTLLSQAAPPPTRELISGSMPKERPSLFITAAEIESIKTRAAEDPAYGRALHEGILKSADNAFAALAPDYLKIPRQEETHVHQRIIANVQNLAVGYAFSGNIEHGRRVAEVLLEYASFYKTLSPSRRTAGKLTAQTLNEAMVMVQVTWAFDLVLPLLSGEEAAIIEKNLLREGAAVIRAQDRGRSNWQSWHNAALGLIGLTLRDSELVEHAILGPSGFIWQLEHSLERDGLWYELSISYQDFTMHALTLLAEGASRAGIDLYQVDVDGHQLKSLYLAPLYFSYNNLNQPPFHDAHQNSRLSSGGTAWNYPYAWKHFRDPVFLWLWQLKKKNLNSEETGRRIPALIAEAQIGFAVNEPVAPEVAAPSRFAVGSAADEASGLRHLLGSTIFSQSGVAILRGPGGVESAEVSMIWKPRGTEAGHQHPNNLAIDWQSYRHRWLSASGKWAKYATPLHKKWVKQTLSDNTLVVDGISQKPADDNAGSSAVDGEGDPSSGRLVAFTNGPVFGFVRAETDKVYPGTRLDRRLIHTREYTLDFFSVKGSRKHTFDWTIHITGELEESDTPLAPRTTPIKGGVAYSYLKDLKEVSKDSTWTSVWKEAGVPEEFVLTTLGAPESRYTVGTSPWNRRSRSTVLVSREGKQAAFASLLQTRTDSTAICVMEWKGESPLESASGEASLLIQRPDGGHDWLKWQPTAKAGVLSNMVKYNGSDIFARFDATGSLKAVTLIAGARLEVPPLALEADSSANWSWQALSEGAFLLIHDHPSATQFTVQSPVSLSVWRIDSNGERQDEVLPETKSAGSSWTLAPYSQYLFAAPDFSGELPPMAKTFRP